MLRACALYLLLATPLIAKWFRAESGHHVVLSEAGERQARDLLGRLQTAHKVFGLLFPSGRHQPLPVVAYQLSTPHFRAVRPDTTAAGFYQGGPDRDSIVLEAGRPPRILFHEYTHLALHHTTGPLPRWLEEGLAEYYSTVEVSGSRIRAGSPIPEHLANLAMHQWMSAVELSQVGRAGRGHETAPLLFYAQSWALVHMLRTHQSWRGAFPQLLTALASGEPQGQAFQRLYGRGLSDALIDLKAYLGTNSLAVLNVPAPDLMAAAPTNVGPLPEGEGEREYARLSLQAGHKSTDDALFRKLSSLRTPTTRDRETLALLALARGDRTAALAEFRTVIAMPEASAVSFFEYAMLLREDAKSPDERKQAERLLERAVERNPQYAEAHFLLATFAANANRHAEAIEHLEKAVTVLPRQSLFWHAMSISYHALNLVEKSLWAAQRALDAAETAEQTEMARAALRLTQTPASAAPASSVIVPDSWRNREGDARVSGVLERIDCIGKQARLHLRVNGKPAAFWIEDPGAVLLKNQSSITFEFRCGVQKPIPVEVEYTRQIEADRLTSGIVRGLEFR